MAPRGWRTDDPEKPRMTAAPSKSSRKRAVIISLVVLVILFQTTLYISRRRPSLPRNLLAAQEWLQRYAFLHYRNSEPDRIVHPIPQLMQKAEADYKALMRKQSRTLGQAVAEYRRRYKMDPPRDFDLWFEFAKESHHIMIDEYDLLMKDLAPFRALSGAEIRRRAWQVRRLRWGFLRR